ncbi:MG2 domain-containing protein [Telluria mixta]|uniref:MG2 domain-containing protein n=1 Tax=Telluria mixta TaxID=34071 RepID=A0ABT2C6P0_9BURK|nr:MG2 domain-containing protein [Telluria mixta]MCS0633052.1 MG2 domain-containing protein [Telluria mixta]WEM96131.1 MG2 domain-containing protein [Telluria mixta]
MAALRRLLCFVLLCCWSGAWAQTTVSGFSPEGQVRRVRQVVARFAQPMVPFGDLRADTPFDVACPVPGSGHWVDAQTWSYDFERDLPGATSCRFTLKPGVRDLAGQPLAGQLAFNVATGGPAVLESLPHEGASGIDEKQAFVLALSAPASNDSILKQAWCRADGASDKIGVTLLTGEQREQVLRTDRWFVRQVVAEDNGKEEAGPYTDARLRADEKAGRLARIVVLQCRRTLPSNAEVALVWGAGVAAPNGIATAEDQTLSFKTRADFTARFNCEKVNTRSQCIPFQPMRVDFSAPVRAADAAKIYLEGPGGKRWPGRVEKEGAQTPEFVGQVSMPGPFPEQSKFTLHLPADLRDDAGRSLVNAGRFPLAVRTGEQPPLVKFAAPFGIIEANGDRLLPVTVRNVEAQLAGRMHTNGVAMRLDASRTADVLTWLRKVAGPHGGLNPSQPDGDQLKVSIFKGAKPDALQRFTLPKPLGRRAFEVIGIPLRQPGFYAVELESPRLGAALNAKGRTAYVRSAALVTNLAAHFKLGAQSSLVWVTSLDKGQPVAGARVEVRDCGARLLWSGTSDAAGIARIRQALPHARCKEGDIYVVTAARGDDFTFTLSDWQQGIEAWRFNLPTGSRDEDTRIVATVFDRTLLRAGETVHMKHYLRRRTQQGFAFVRAKDPAPKEVRDWRAQELGTDKTALPARGFLVHQGSGEKVEFSLRWDANGSAEGEWAIPTEAKLGVYDVLIGGQVAGDFRVEQFRVPTMKAQLAGPKQPAVAPQAVTLDAQVSYLSGGPAGLAPVKLRSVVQDTGVQFADYDEFALGAGDVREGVVDQDGGGEEDEAESEGAPGQEVARTQGLQLDRAGGARIVVDKLPAIERPKSLLAELSYQDANGETLTVSTRVPLWPSAYVVGIKPDGWLLRRDALKFQAVVLDVAGKPVANVPVAVDLLKRVTYSHRRRLVGGFYAYEYSAEIKRIGEACSGTTDARGLLMCDVKAPVDGDLILRARAHDTQQRVAATHREVYVAGDEEQWFANADHDRIDLLPAQKRYEPGDQARFQVRSPFRRSTVLVTVEREGILDTYVRHLSGRDQTISIPVKASYAPNVFVSALVVRGRVAGVQPTALVDLGKPAYKLGIAPVRVGWKGHELKVDVAADKPVYKVRERAQVTIRVRDPDGTRPAAGTEVAVAAVDAGLLELMPNTSWNLLETMMHERSLQVETSTAQMQVVGKRHFGRKAFPHGGGGGRGAGRELFETLLLWKGKVVLDANGEARVDVPLNDSLTSFRIVAVASSGAGRFGTGGTDIRTSQDLMLVSGLPPQVREGDRLGAGFTLRNASDRRLAVRLDAGVTADGGKAQALPRQDIVLAPGESREAGWDYTVPAGATTLQWDVAAAGEGASDRMRVTQQVNVAVPVRTLQATLVQIDGTKTMPVERPADALPGRGGIRTTLQARLGSDLPGVRDYMAAYPYTCFEQRTSRAVALQDEAMWQKVVATLPSHLDGDGLVKYFAPMEQGSDVLTAYVLSVTHEAGYAIPDELRGRMEAGLAAFVEGKIVRGSGRATGELAVRKLAALEALSRATEVQPALLDSIEVQPNLWPTSAVIDWYLILKRTPALPQRDQRLAQAGQILRARLNLQGTTMGFSTERADGWWWLMTSVDVNANRLLLATLDDPAWKIDAGRLARGTLGRQQHGHWDTTTANAWGTVALKRFSETYEREPVTGSANLVVTGADGKPVSWTGTVPATVLQAWPQGRGTLTMRQLGSGKPWATVQSLAAVPLKAPLSSGYRIARTVTPVEQKVKGTWSRGDVYRVHLDIDAQSDMTWVVVDDPIPAGASVLGSGLGRDSQIATAGERRTGWTWPAFEERLHTGYRAYYEWVPKGRFTVEYTVRLNNEGRFALPSTRVEAMYAPEMFGEVPNAGMTVQ